jgi:hypothetical protein
MGIHDSEGRREIYLRVVVRFDTVQAVVEAIISVAVSGPGLVAGPSTSVTLA